MWPFDPPICRHYWEAISTTFTPPLNRGVTGNISGERMAKYVYGFTTVVSKCTGCGELTTEQFVGEIVLPDFAGTQHKTKEVENTGQYKDIGDTTKTVGHIVKGKKAKESEPGPEEPTKLKPV